MNAETDAERPLTGRGAESVARVAPLILERFAVARIICSPYRRTKETASILAAQQPGTELAICHDITPDGHCVRVADDLAAHDVNNVILVTHQPFIGDFVEYLTGSVREIYPATAIEIESESYAERQGKITWVQSV